MATEVVVLAVAVADGGLVLADAPGRTVAVVGRRRAQGEYRCTVGRYVDPVRPWATDRSKA